MMSSAVVLHRGVEPREDTNDSLGGSGSFLSQTEGIGLTKFAFH